MQEERSKDPGLNRLGIPARTRPPRVAKQGFRPVSGLTQTVALDSRRVSLPKPCGPVT